MARKWGFRVLSALSMVVALYGFSFMFLPEDVVPGPIKERFLTYPWAGWGHVVGGGFALLLGPTQFSPWLRRKHMVWHRWLGRMYAVAVLWAGLAGLFLSQLAFGGFAGQAGFAALALLWITSLIFAWVRIRQGNKGAHRKWMIRNFALTLAAVSLRFLLPLMTGAMGMEFESAYPAIAWLCWVPNLIIAEWMILHRK